MRPNHKTGQTASRKILSIQRDHHAKKWDNLAFNGTYGHLSVSKSRIVVLFSPIRTDKAWFLML